MISRRANAKPMYNLFVVFNLIGLLKHLSSLTKRNVVDRFRSTNILTQPNNVFTNFVKLSEFTIILFLERSFVPCGIARCVTHFSVQDFSERRIKLLLLTVYCLLIFFS